jgi:hypothetical protein
MNGIRLGNVNINNVAFTDDLTLLATTVPGLQALIDECVDYATRWRFNYGVKKSTCMNFGEKKTFINEPTWKLGGHIMSNVTSSEIMGIRCI